MKFMERDKRQEKITFSKEPIIMGKNSMGSWSGLMDLINLSMKVA